MGVRTLGLSKGEATRERVVAEAARLTAARGFAAVSLNDVAEAVGLSKSGLFKHFDSKDDMLMAVLEATIARFEAFVWAPSAELPTARERLISIFERSLDWEAVENAAGGCLIRMASVELDDQPGPLRDHLQRRQHQWKRTITRQFQALRDPPLSEDEARAATFEMKSFSLGFADDHRLLEDKGARQAALDAFTRLLDRLS